MIKKNLILVIVSFAMLMESVDTTIINTAIPIMAQSLHVDPIDLKLAMISYLLSLAIFIPISGYIADKFGLKKVFMMAIAVFTVSSIWCGLSHSLWELIMARFIQGLGGSLTLPIGRLIVIRTSERHELVSKMSVVVMLASVGMMSGPVLGGLITHYFSWRWVFFVNVPIGILAVILSFFLLPQFPKRAVHQLDMIGFLLFGLGLSTLTYFLSAFSESTMNDLHLLFLFGVSMLLLLLYTWHSKGKPYPIVNVGLLHIRTFQISVLGNLFCRVGFGGLPFLLPLLLQIGLGFSPQLSGLLLAPTALGVLMVKPMSYSILRYLGYKKVLIINTFLVAMALGSFAFITATTSIFSIAILTFIYGFLIALQYTGMNSLAYANVNEDKLSAATSIMSTIQQLAQSFGVAIAAIFVRLFADSALHLTILTFHQTFISLGFMTLLSLFTFVRMAPTDGHELIESPTH